MIMLFHNIPCIPLWLSASVISSLNALVFGLDTGTIGPVTTMPSFQATLGELSPSLHGIVVSAALLPGALTALTTGVLADRYGRTRMIALGSLIYGIGAALETASMWLAMFIVGRLFKGIGEGLFLSTVYVHVCEISPARIRGVMASVPQFFIAAGLVTGYFVCYGTSRLPGSVSWRLPIAFQAGIAFINSAAAIFLPQSPRWLQAQGRSEDAHRVIEQLGFDEEEKLELQSHSTAPLSVSPELSFRELIRQTAHDLKEAFDAPFRGRTLFGCFLLASQQLSGVDGVLYYAPILLQAAGISSLEASFLASGVSAILILVVTVAGTFFADAWGRKTSTLVGGTSIFTLWAVSASLYAAGEVHADKGAARWVVIVSIYLFAAIFSVTWAIGLRTFMIESLPSKTRSSAASLAQSSNWLANFVVALTTPIFIAKTAAGAYYFFAFTTLLCTVVSAFYMFETKGRTLESIEKRYAEKQALRKQQPALSMEKWLLPFPIKGFRLRGPATCA